MAVRGWLLMLCTDPNDYLAQIQICPISVYKCVQSSSSNSNRCMSICTTGACNWNILAQHKSVTVQQVTFVAFGRSEMPLNQHSWSFHSWHHTGFLTHLPTETLLALPIHERHDSYTNKDSLFQHIMSHRQEFQHLILMNTSQTWQLDTTLLFNR